jgi:hypothetical protein
VDAAAAAEGNTRSEFLAQAARERLQRMRATCGYASLGSRGVGVITTPSGPRSPRKVRPPSRRTSEPVHSSLLLGAHEQRHRAD